MRKRNFCEAGKLTYCEDEPNTVKQRTGETRPVAVRIGNDTALLLQTGEHVPVAHVEKLQDGAVVIAHGKKSKRGVIKAKHGILPNTRA